MIMPNGNMSVSSIFIFVIVSCLFFNDKSFNAAFKLSMKNGTVVEYRLNNAHNDTFNWPNTSIVLKSDNSTHSPRSNGIDCFGLGSTFASALHWFFVGSCEQCDNLDVKFYLSSRRQPQRVEVMVGKQFGLEWTDFDIERRTVIIVHGFLSHSNETWIKHLEDAFLLWGDVNVIVVDWSEGGNTWNYYKAVVYTRIVGQRITRFLSQIVNATMDDGGTDVDKWGPLHFVGHSLGAHICGFVCHNLKLIQDRWVIQRVTGLDPAQPCFSTDDPSMKLDRTDAKYVDIIHTNARLLSRLGLGLPTPIGHVDFYPNGGMKQPGCGMVESSFFSFLPFSRAKIRETICSHGRSYIYLTESLIAAASKNCSFWARHWDMTYRGALTALQKPCANNNCTEMGIAAEAYPHRGTFYVATAEQSPFCGKYATGHVISVQRCYQKSEKTSKIGDIPITDNNQLSYMTEDLAEELDD